MMLMFLRWVSKSWYRFRRCSCKRSSNRISRCW